MRTVFCAGRWICLLLLAGAMLPSESKGNKKAVLCYLKGQATNGLQAFSVAEPCCRDAGSYVSGVVTKCFKQKARKGCNSNNYVLQMEGGQFVCIKSDSKWIIKQIQLGNIVCE